ncbi:hypothetical protein AZF37_06115 [endosymbiont 'TC1' of Trimyema compressum]|uniref:DUF3658 domain-containing protein n=1 Tax=endosymbiont 'TC1' of Trimyema compressum TaxID=243899 RepID=UPI0007F0FBDD|nr:DUF3658 domain-containing protein [endosymbiont 'TC1' of Trimyema compressum]AMP20803.1 hypothetical protein AZF37_06115 [endosymbiont 'TC1' of Trimyema compressum]
MEEERESFKTQLKRLYKTGDMGEDIRIWWSDAPAEACGFYWAMHILQDSKSRITSVKIPPFKLEGDSLRFINGTSDLSPEDIVEISATEKNIIFEERKAVALFWEKLVTENAPLRAVVNGIPCSLEEDFYDWVLWKIFPQRDFQVVEAIGLSLIQGTYCGVTDWWYAQRIKAFIRKTG